MVTHQALKTLVSFSPKELKRFNKFLNSSYSNTNKRLLDVYSFLIKYYPKFDGRNLTKESIHNKIYPSKIYKDSTVRNLLSELNEAEEKFLVYEFFEKDFVAQSDYLLRALKDKNQKEQLQMRINEFEVYLNNSGWSSKYFLEKYKLEDHKINFKITYDKNINANVIKNRISQINESSKYLTLHYLVENLNRQIKIYLYREKFNIQPALTFIEKILSLAKLEKISELIEDKGYKEYLELYLNLLHMLNNQDNDKHYDEYRKSYNLNLGKLSKDEKSFHNSYLINYCVRKINYISDCTELQNELFDLYSELLQNEYYISDEKDYLPADLYRGIVVNALNLGKYQWTKKFMNEYHLVLHEQDRENMVNLGLFLYNGYTGKYYDALNYVQKIKLDNFILKYDEHSLKIKIFFELGLYDEAICAVKSFKEFLKYNKMVSDYRKSKYMNFVKLTGKLISYKLGKKSVEPGLVKHCVLESKAIIYKKWLLEKIGLEENSLSVRMPGNINKH